MVMNLSIFYTDIIEIHWEWFWPKIETESANKKIANLFNV